ncbi:MAG: lytic transglycosylase domain-containing protein [Sphingomonas sp.]|uniref:lytic transglycosylase domain-containing protein n=1 Tax=Sphingomonas sp. TaxID=28214 RepID=UPI0017D6E0E6|nr:lytic transglycosylase domain-containing protein [Sphingomonas sp.]MBA3668189.1 lytic transglycosylase domain-containing protein [Sphingomonas sp.]
MRYALLLFTCCLSAAPAVAQTQDDPLAPLDPVPSSVEPIVIEPPSPPAAAALSVATPNTTPTIVIPPPPPRVIPRDWRGVLAAIDSSDWEGARLGIAGLPDGPLKPLAEAELYTGKGSPKVELASIVALLAEAPDLPQAEQLQRMALARGAYESPVITYPRQTVFLGSAPRRQKTRPVAGEPLADALLSQLEPLVKINDFAAAELLLNAQAPYLTFDARAESAQRVAWIYYGQGRDADARRIADSWRGGAAGDWAAQAAWISALASWRLGECNPALAAFRDTSRLTTETELQAAANYWAARSAQACRRPREVEPLMRAAARSPESFYGLVARETLGMGTVLPRTSAQGTRGVLARPNIVRARELTAIGRSDLASELLRYQARIGPANEHADLIRAAEEIGLPAAQYWLAHNGPSGAIVQPAQRFPTLRWVPVGGWRIDPALAFAHARQESDFRSWVVSPAGAVGLMQVRPGTAGDAARVRGTTVSAAMLTDPSTNLEYGQSFIELMRGKSATRGQLPKVIAAYNAGPLPVDRWNYINDKGDPLLWIESLSYWETRYYVPSVLRNMWVYQGLAGAAQPTLKSIAEHRWPAFPAARGGAITAR